MRTILFVAFVLVPLARGAVDYETDIRPILEERCLDCHGPDKSKAELRVDRRVSLLRGGDGGLPAIAPGNTMKSHLLERVRSMDPDERMPPKGDALGKEEVELLRKWIEEGADWPGQMEELGELVTDHWSFQPVRRPVPPEEARNPVDAFLNARLAEKGLKPNGATDARALIRRVSVIL
ncbi:MAG: c-type cytochrome domain-containing protein, partial [Verrucomicrobiota bacterium]|nr:c-type cytochrome domain-containing protein [Verrucomicrobiota bacterium]